MDEIDFLMRVTAGGLSTSSGNDAKLARLDEWLNTPRGSIYGRPNWGNIFTKYKHQPTDESTAVIIENESLPILRVDLPDVRILGIRCDPGGIQDYILSIMTDSGSITKEI